jgi:meso-butanediol dehydrogenase / (S,S)-butanediol dehydrogenase / diacetyl reductase
LAARKRYWKRLQRSAAQYILVRVSTRPEDGTERMALVTGGASGFGLAVARALIREGHRVAIVDINPESLKAAAEALDGKALALEADVRSPESIRGAVRQSEEAHGGLDTVVMCAGIIHLKPLPDVTEDDWDRVLDVNLKGAFLTAQAAAPRLRASGRGRIVAIGSDASKRGSDLLQAYSASKFGLVGLTESLAAELAQDSITVNCVCPVGCPTTGMGQAIAAWKSERTARPIPDVLVAAARTIPLGRNATEDDVANLILFLISDAASFLTGLAIDVDGGAHVGFIPGIEPKQA